MDPRVNRQKLIFTALLPGLCTQPTSLAVTAQTHQVCSPLRGCWSLCVKLWSLCFLQRGRAERSNVPEVRSLSGLGSGHPPEKPVCVSSWLLFPYCIILAALVVHWLSHVLLFVSPGTAARQASLSITISRSLLKLMSIESVMPANHLILCRPLLLLPSIFPSIRVFSRDLAFHIRWLKHCRFSISPCNEYPGLISFRIVWLDLLAV